MHRQNEEAKTGYGIVINTFRMWITSDPSKRALYESKLNRLESQKTRFPKFMSYVNVIHAYILSRLGPRWRDQAKSLYREALLDFPRNFEWLFGLALMVGREARHHRGVVGAWRGPLPTEIMRMFKEEEKILRKVLSIQPTFHLARAFYGQVLFNLNELSRVEQEFTEALKGEPENRTICLLAAKVYRIKGPFSYAESMLRGLLERVNTAEINFQLGCLYRYQSRNCKNAHRDSYRREALRFFEAAVELDNCHYPSISGCAEMNAALGDKETALDLCNDLFESAFKDKPHHASNEFKALESALRLNIFDPLQCIKRLHRIIELAVTLTDDKKDDIQVPDKSLDKTIDTNLGKLERYTKRNRDLDVAHEAKLKFAHANMLLKRYEKATELYKSLYDESTANGEDPQDEIIFGLGKCYYRKGEKAQGEGYNEWASKQWENAIGMADRLAKSSYDAQADELYADVYLAKAKALSPSLRSNTSKLLEKAVGKGSLEGCYLYMSYLNDLKKEFFTDHAIPQTLAEIQRVCEMEMSFHTKFTVTLQNGSQIVNDVSAKREFIQRALEEVIAHDAITETTFTSESLSSMADQLKDLREKRLQYERELLQSRKSNDFGKSYVEKLSAVIQLARKMLDNCVSVCQTALTTKPANNSMFIVTFDFKEGKLKPEKCKTEVKKWARNKTFPNLQLPDGFLEKIIEIQPMYDEQNLWLLAIHSINNLQKHNPSKCELGEMYTIQLESNSTFRSIKTEDVVKQSCAGVEALSRELIRMCFEFAQSEDLSESLRGLECTDQ